MDEGLDLPATRLLAVLGFLLGWPLMVATISIQDSDGFEGFSRAFNYQFSRPWQYVRDWTTSIVFGSFMSLIVVAIVSLATHLAAWTVSNGMGAQRVRAFLTAGPEWMSPSGPQIAVSDAAKVHLTGDNDSGSEAQAADDGGNAGRPGSIGVWLAGFWLHVTGALANSFATSFFWTSATIIYFLLRKHEDNIEFSEIYVAEDEPQDAPRRACSL